MKIYVKAMSLSRKQAIGRLDSLSMNISEHLIKCVVYGKYRSTDFHGWISEIAAWIEAADRPNVIGAKLKARDYRNSIFGQFGSTFYDAEDNLSFFESTNLYRREGESSKLPYFKINNEVVRCLFNCYNEVKDKCIPLLMNKEHHSKLFWYNTIESIVNNHLYKLVDENIVTDIHEIE